MGKARPRWLVEGPNRCVTHTIILAHGILGFGSFPDLPSPLNYFNGVAAHLSKQGHLVTAPQVDPVGSVAVRGTQLMNAILQVPLLEDQSRCM